MRLSTAGAVVLLVVALARGVSAQPRAGVVFDPRSEPDTAFARDVAASIASAGYAIQFIEAATLTNAPALSPQAFALLILPHGRTLPADSIEPVQHCLSLGGSLMVLGLPLWASVGTAGNSAPSAPARVPRLEALAPEYLFYPVSAPVEFVVPATSGFAPRSHLKAARNVSCSLLTNPRAGAPVNCSC